MAAVEIRIGPLAFDHAEYDADGDVLYLHVGAPTEAEGEETPEGHVLRFEPGTQRIVGLTVINARWLLDRDGFVRVTVPETIAASADDLAPALSDFRRPEHPFYANAFVDGRGASALALGGGRSSAASASASLVRCHRDSANGPE